MITAPDSRYTTSKRNCGMSLSKERGHRKSWETLGSISPVMIMLSGIVPRIATEFCKQTIKLPQATIPFKLYKGVHWHRSRDHSALASPVESRATGTRWVPRKPSDCRTWMTHVLAYLKRILVLLSARRLPQSPPHERSTLAIGSQSNVPSSMKVWRSLMPQTRAIATRTCLTRTWSSGRTTYHIMVCLPRIRCLTTIPALRATSGPL